ncbi:MAG: hypothetical protein JNN17_15190 [Verrucomicrobiaceae bacterium]|nr:hypothetical protein [Verrucomicrobiaceae bacterium]
MVFIWIAWCSIQKLEAQNLGVFSVSQSAGSITSFNGGSPASITDQWAGIYDLGTNGTVSGSSSLPNPGLESSASGSFFGTQAYSSNLWQLSGNATAIYNTGLGNVGSPFPTIRDTSFIGAAITFSVDQPFVLSLTASLNSSFSGPGPNSGVPANNAALVSLFVVAANGQFVNQYVTEWNTVLGSSGGSYTDSFNDAVFRLEFGASADVFSNTPGAFGTQTSAYDLQLSVSPIPEPSGALLALLGGGWFLGPRRRRA